MNKLRITIYYCFIEINGRKVEERNIHERTYSLNTNHDLEEYDKAYIEVMKRQAKDILDAEMMFRGNTIEFSHSTAELVVQLG